MSNEIKVVLSDVNKIVVKVNWLSSNDYTSAEKAKVASMPTNASQLPFTPTGNLSSTNVQSALAELDTEKANKAQEPWITPTLLGSTTNHTTYITRYYKNTIGEVVLDGRIKDFSVGSSFFQLPSGYRPAQLQSFAVNSNNGVGIVNINTDGGVIVAVGNVTTLFLTGIRFRAT